MTLERFKQLEKACEDFCDVRYVGCRTQRDMANEMLKDAIRSEREKKKSSKYFVYERTVNHGTRNYPNLENALFYEKLSDFKETDKCYVNDYKRISKDKIIAWLS